MRNIKILENINFHRFLYQIIKRTYYYVRFFFLFWGKVHVMYIFFNSLENIEKHLVGSVFIGKSVIHRALRKDFVIIE